jgi:4-hydroxybenzoyl-CoA thioesterase
MRPNALAVLRLITNSYLVGACIECDFKIPSGIGEVIDLTLLVEDIGRSSLAIAIVCHRDNIERLRARMVTAMMSLDQKAVPMPHGLREAIESYRRRTAAGAK